MNTQTKQTILAAAVGLAEANSYHSFTRSQVAKRAGCAEGLVNYYYETMAQLRRAVMGEAIRTRSLKIIAQGIAVGDPRTKKIPEELRQAALASLIR